jgi:hypothetical protein
MARFWTQHRLVAGGLAAVGLGGLVVLAVMLIRSGPVAEEPPAPVVEEPEPEAPAEEEPEPEVTRMPLTGVETDDLPERPALIVKVSNSPEARPHTGLDAADVVLEELTEGGITRFVAVFHSRLPEVVGPVRSARPVDIQLMSGFGHPGFAHSGARREVREMLARAPAATITEGAPGFFRDRGEYASHPVAPHNLFLEVEPALHAVTDLGARPLVDLGWVFDEEPPVSLDPEAEGETIEIAMSAAYRTSWTYEANAGQYRRQQNGQPFEVTGDGEIGAANVVVLQVRHYVGSSGYPETDVLGEGDAIVLRDGKRYAARWSKREPTDPLQVLTADGGEPFPLKPGATWFHLPDELPS